mmetsp:Transcript_123011/g.217833  ORF Transcript_123011/g.217833 Transcript_123011/m.217833 type:complete len:147 (-) Transcript_123011:61-501(-)
MACGACCGADEKAEVIDATITENDEKLPVSKFDETTTASAAQEPPKLGPEGKSSPPSKVWEVELKKVPGDVIGIDVFGSDSNVLGILQVKEGLMLKWNNANPGDAVVKGDYIIQINGESGDSKAMLDQVKNNDMLKLVVHRYDGGR